MATAIKNGYALAHNSMLTPPKLESSNCIVFFDFDNTITHFDVLDDIIKHFAIDETWMELEQAWENGKIGSKECLEGQLQSIRVTKASLSQYLSTVKLDSSFNKLITFLRRKKIKFVIVSDSFTFIIKEILRHNGIGRVKVFANEVKFQKDRLIPSFPFFSQECSRCAHCKKKHLLEYPNQATIYVGDGLSDICPALCADLVFAKGSLLEYLRKNDRSCIKFKNMEDIYTFFDQQNTRTEKSDKVFAVA